MNNSRITRRDVLQRAGGIVAGAMFGLPATAQTVRYSTGTEKAKVRAPANATDCHFHIYDNRFPPAPGGLPAPDALPEDYRGLQARTGTTRGVVVQPSLFGVDNRPTLAGMATLGPNFRAVVIADNTT